MSEKISAAELRQRMQSGEQLQIVDVRSATEFAAGHVPCATNIPLEQLGSRLADISVRDKLLLICESGQRANAAAGWVCEREDVLVLEGGTRAWRELGYPTVASVASRWSLERQVRLAAGSIVLAATLLAVLANPRWVYLAMFIGAGLTFAAVTGICPMGSGLARMPWNRPRTGQVPPAVDTCCSQAPVLNETMKR